MSERKALADLRKLDVRQVYTAEWAHRSWNHTTLLLRAEDSEECGSGGRNIFIMSGLFWADGVSVLVQHSVALVVSFEEDSWMKMRSLFLLSGLRPHRQISRGACSALFNSSRLHDRVDNEYII